MPYPSALKAKPKCIFFTDFDGNDYLTDHLGFGYDLRRDLNIEILEGRMSFRDGFQKMMDSVKTPYPECIKVLIENIKLDPTFKEFYQWTRENNVPVVVLSSGMVPIIRGLLVHLVGSEANDIEIISNNVQDRPGKSQEQEDGWDVKFHDDSDFGHDKSLAIRPYVKHFAERPNEARPTMFYAGDGVSDLSAAQETDLLFAKKGHDLVTYCEREGVPFTIFEDWTSILETTKEIYEGKTSIQKVAAEGVEDLKHGGNEIKTTK